MASAREIHCASSLGDFRGSPIGMAGRQQCSSAFLMEEHDAWLDRCCRTGVCNGRSDNRARRRPRVVSTMTAATSRATTTTMNSSISTASTITTTFAMSTARDAIPAGRLMGSGPAGTDPAIVRTLARRAHQRKRGRPIVGQVSLGLAGGAPAGTCGSGIEDGSGSGYGAFRVDKENAGTPLQRSLVTALAVGVSEVQRNRRDLGAVR
jgi:hypothetical protein